jgi:probable F420-dependent oxidoreductase
MKFALGVPLMNFGRESAFLNQDAIVELAREAEASGWDAIYLTEHPIPGEKWIEHGGHHAVDPFVTLAFAAAVTTSLKLLTNLTVLPYRNPFMLAKTVATLDRLSNGRMLLGVGTGYLKPEYFAIGVDFEERNDLFDESIEVMRQTWTGQTVNYEGRHFNARGVAALPTPAQDPVPIWIGGNSKLSRRRAAEKAQGWMPMPNPAAVAKTTRSPALETVEELADMLAYVHEHAEKVGRTDPLDVMFMCFDGGLPESPDFQLQQHVDALHAQAAVGVTWNAVNGADGGREVALDTLRRYGRDVIAGFR